MERKLKPGDRVRIKALGIYYPFTEQGLFVNNTATVRSYSGSELSGGTYVIVATDGDTSGAPSAWSFDESELELLGDAHG